MHGNGSRRVCSECGNSLASLADDHLSHRELRGPRNITSSNVDRFFDDRGQRFLFIEEKRPAEPENPAQMRALIALSRSPRITVWIVRGTPTSLHVDALDRGQLIPIMDGDYIDYQNLVFLWFSRRSTVPQLTRSRA